MKRQIFILCILFLYIGLLSAKNIIKTDYIITTNTEIADVSLINLHSKTVYASGTAEFTTNSGFVRILLSDDYGYDLLVYESIPLMTTNNVDNFTLAAIESIDIPTLLNLTKIRIEINNAALKNLIINISDAEKSPIQRTSITSAKIATINNNLRARNALWVAGETDFSKKSYEEKKAVFGGILPDLGGAEYYIGGIFELNPGNTYNPANISSNYVEAFDWRNRHGRDWTTPWKDQGNCGSCWAFAAAGAVEGLVNLYYNRKLDLDLSEQQIISCAKGGCTGGLPIDALDYIRTDGVVNEQCFIYSQTNGNCNDVCNNPAEKIFIANKAIFNSSNYQNPLDILKSKIIHNGLLAGIVWGWGHAMTLVGYGTIKAGDIVFYANMSQNQTMDDITVGEEDPRIGQTYFIFKNSTTWGTWFYVLADNMSQFSSTAIPLSPITSLNYTDADIICEDRDGDGYYYWGIGPKPAHCPPCAPNEPDGDDSNPNLGPMDEYGYCAEITPLAENITVSQLWNTDKSICRNVSIQSGATLIITATVNVLPNYTITIQDGGRLVLSGGVIDDGNIVAKSGSELFINGNGKILLGSYDNLDIQLGAVMDYTYGEVLIK